ncbi:hypothetical protein BXZ70DRAFT_894922 [Cristinia sonorae]|uniref:Uncharacterized protein n=1 Tax=Cristinia sonorae TaxID=1940300 RepID=A0A8K0UMH4_9AGAR|nr:hypothetical protein BXZ70DRAFT_894922 [Cristinia sonorae]
MHTVESVRYLQPSDRSLSITHSLQTVTSVTPLNQSFPHSETIEEETPATSPSTPVTPSRKRDRRQSMYSNKTAKSYVSSLITRISHSSGDRRSARQTAAHWFRRKPLPPVPRLPNMSLTQEVEYQQAEAALPLPDLVNRAQTLSRMLDKGHRPHSSNHPSSHTASRLASQAPSEDGDGVQVFGDEGAKMTGVAPRPGMFNATPQRRGRSQDYKDSQWNTLQDPPSPAHGKPPSKPLVFFRHHRLCVGMTVIFIIVIVIAVAVSVTLTRKNKANPRCPDNLAGATCSLNATCVCTTTTSGQCSNLAQNLVDLVPTLNSLFHSNFTPATLSKAVWLAQGNPGSSCASQAQIVDVAPALDQGISPNRTQWAQTALLWDFVQTSNLADVQTLQKFVLSAPWSKLAEFDGPTPDPSSSFTTRVSGFDFNFAAQTVTAPPATFVDAGQPSSAQINQVDGTARSALDRMYTFALASATQEQKALATYWSSVLQQKPSDLNAFLSQIRGSHILLPFDATATPGNQKVSAMLTNSTTAPFPPPLACYPGLSTAQLQAINAFESSVFGLPSAPATSKFDTACFPDRPIYGVLDVARLRLPFMDSRTGVAKQAAALRTQATEPASRAVVYNGEVFSALPGSSSLPSLTPAVLEPRRFGTMNHLEHVVLDYLQAIPDVNVAIALVQFVLSGPVAPPKSDSILFKSLSTLPVIEVAIFGTIDPFDIDSVVSSFSDPAGKLFFGTDQSLAVRDWAIGAVQSHVEWAELATSSGIVEDDTFTDPTFNQIWNSAFNFFHIPNDLNVGVGNITTGFCALHLLTGCP